MQNKKDFDVTKKYSAFSYATFLLSKQEYSQHKVREKLNEKGYPKKDIEETITKLLDIKYLDDERFTDMFVRSKINGNGWGRYKISMELSMKHGVDKNIIESVLDQYDFDNERIRQYIKKFGTEKPVDNKDYQKRMGFLARKGFSAKLPTEDEIMDFQNRD